MTVVRDLPEQLILAHAPWFMGGMLIVCIVGSSAAGLALIFSGETAGLLTLALGGAVPLALFSMLVKRDQVILDAVRGTVTLQRRTLWSYEQVEKLLTDVEEAILQEMADTARPVLVFAPHAEAIPLVEAYNSGNGPREAVKIITEWLEDWKVRTPRIA